MVLKLRVGKNLKHKHKTIIRRAATGNHFQTKNRESDNQIGAAQKLQLTETHT